MAQTIRKRGFYDPFNPVLISYEIGASKPDPRAYQILLDRLKIAPDQCIFIDDRIENVEAACALGIHGILYQSPAQLKKELECYVGISGQRVGVLKALSSR